MDLEDDTNQQSIKNQTKKLKILIFTDNHLGYKEKHDIRGNDSFETFDECLKIAHEKNVDFVLQAGDLFHEAIPTQETMFNTMRILKKHVLGDGDMQFETTNYKDPNFASENINIALPIFAIHGNHDIPVTQSNRSTLELLSISGYINYFGKVLQTETIIKVEPIIFSKHGIQVALYGIGHIKEMSLKRYLNNKDKQIVFVQPHELTQNNQPIYSESDSFYKILVMHQNRYKGFQNGAPDSKSILFEELPGGVFDLIVWGHEHDARPEPEWEQGCGSYVYQPGSTVATSFSKGEALVKRCGILGLSENLNSNIESIVLKETRAMYIESRSVEDFGCETNGAGAVIDEALLLKKIEDLLKEILVRHKEENCEQFGRIDWIEQQIQQKLLRLENLQFQVNSLVEGMATNAYSNEDMDQHFAEIEVIHEQHNNLKINLENYQKKAKPQIRIKITDNNNSCPTLANSVKSFETTYRNSIANIGELFAVVTKRKRIVNKIKQVEKDEKEFLDILKNKEGNIFNDFEKGNQKDIQKILAENLSGNLYNGTSGDETKCISVDNFLEIIEKGFNTGTDTYMQDVLKQYCQNIDNCFEKKFKEVKNLNPPFDMVSQYNLARNWDEIMLNDYNSKKLSGDNLQIKCQKNVEGLLKDIKVNSGNGSSTKPDDNFQLNKNSKNRGNQKTKNFKVLKDGDKVQTQDQKIYDKDYNNEFDGTQLGGGKNSKIQKERNQDFEDRNQNLPELDKDCRQKPADRKILKVNTKKNDSKMNEEKKATTANGFKIFDANNLKPGIFDTDNIQNNQGALSFFGMDIVGGSKKNNSDIMEVEQCEEDIEQPSGDYDYKKSTKGGGVKAGRPKGSMNKPKRIKKNP